MVNFTEKDKIDLHRGWVWEQRALGSCYSYQHPGNYSLQHPDSSLLVWKEKEEREKNDVRDRAWKCFVYVLSSVIY